MPFIAALIAIGPPAARALIEQWPGAGTQHREAFLYTISRIADEESRDFLQSALIQANTEAHWSQQGLDLLDRTQH